MKNKKIQQAEECSMTNLIVRLITMYPLVSSNLDTNVDFGEKVPSIFQQYQSAFKKHDITMDTWETKNDTFYYTLEYYKDGEAYLYRSEEECKFYFEQTAQMACIEKAFEICNKKIFESIPINNINVSTDTQKENPLKRPSAHSLIDIFKELKFGRTAESQQYLQECIEFLEQFDEDTDCCPELTFDEKGGEELIQDSMDKTIIDSSKLRPYNRINVLSSQEGKISMDDLGEELTKIVFKYASSHMMKKDLELSIKIMRDVIRHPQFYLNI